MNNQNYDSGSYTKGFVFGAIIGGTIGAITALLLAPKSGAELRKELAEKSTDMYETASDYLVNVEENVGSAVSTTVNEGRIRAQKIINSAKNQAEELLGNAEDILKDARSKATTAKEQVQDKIDNFRQAAKAGAETFKSEMKSSKEEADNV